MSGLSPSRRLRTKTSDLTDFFRSSTSHGHQSRQTQNDSQLQIPVPQPPLPDLPQPEVSTTLKKMTTKIPFLGRPRKKSTHSVTTGVPLHSTSSRGHESTEIVESATAKSDRRLSHPVPSSSPELSQRPPLPISSPPISISPPSLSSKFAAHFTPSRSRKVSSRPIPIAPIEGSTPDTLSPPISPRASSFDSGSSNASGSRSPTPQPALQPTITVSLSPDNMDEYQDLFTLPRTKITTPKRHPSTPASQYRDKYHDGESNITISPSLLNSPLVSSGTPNVAHLRNYVPQDFQLQGSGSSQPPKGLKTRSISGKRLDSTAGNRESTEESAFNSRKTFSPELSTVFDITIPTRKPSYVLPRSRYRAPSTNERPSEPPSIPLPDPPTVKSIPIISSPRSLSSRHLTSSLGSGPVAPTKRPRAHTIGTTTPTSRLVASTPLSLSETQKYSNGTHSLVIQSSDNEDFDLRTATAEKLREALATRNKQYEELAHHFLMVTAAHAEEKKIYERRVSNLEKDIKLKDRELKGFVWMVTNNVHGGSNTLSGAQVAYRQSPTPPSSRLGFRMVHTGEDSGADSHLTSGTESVSDVLLASGTSETESTSSIKKIRRPQTFGEPSFKLYRSPSVKSVPVRGLGTDGIIPEVPNRTSLSQRSSVYSLSSSAASSGSSLLLPAAGAAIPSLSAIPESSYHAAIAKPVRVSGSLSASEAEKGRASRATRRISTPTTVSSSSSSSQATSAYSANLKRGRPPSIAQVLEKSALSLETPESLQTKTEA